MNNEFQAPCMDNIYVEEDRFWFISTVFDALLRIDKGSMTSDLLKILPIENNKRVRLYSRCIKINNCVYCLPKYGEGILVYNLLEDKFKKIKFTSQNRFPGILNWKLLNSSLCLVSYFLKQLIFVNTKLNEVECYYQLNMGGKEILYSTFEHNYLYCLSNDNEICEVNLATEEQNTYKINIPNEKLNTIAYDGNLFWLTGLKSSIYVWNKINNQIVIVNDFPQSYYKNYFTKKYMKIGFKSFFIDSIFLKNKVFLIPFWFNYILVNNVEKDEMNSIELGNNKSDIDINSKICGCKLKKVYVKDYRYIGVFSYSENILYEIDAVSLNVTRLEYKLSINHQLEIMQDYIEQGRVYYEKKNDLYGFLELLKR